VGSHQHTPFLPHPARGRGFSKLWLLGVGTPETLQFSSLDYLGFLVP
jgi:hypothetical protein